MNERIALIHPNNPGNYVQGSFNRENLGLGYLSAELKNQGFDPLIIDARIIQQSPEEIIQEILDFHPFLIGFSVIAKDATPWCESVAAAVKAEDQSIHITMGNYFPTLQPDRAFQAVPQADSIVIREGDLTLPDLAERISRGADWQSIKGIAHRLGQAVKVNPPSELVKNLDGLPLPDHYGIRFNLREFSVEGSRGCYCKCTFCSIDPFFKAGPTPDRWRPRSAASIAGEIQLNTQLHPEIPMYRFVDPDFIGAPKHEQRLRDLVTEFIKRRIETNFIFATRTNVVNGLPRELWKELKTIGLREVYLGVENADPYIKRMMHKGSVIEDDKRAIAMLDDLGIKVRYGYMMITPWTTEADIVENARTLRSLGFPRLDKYFQEMYLVPGTGAVDLTKETSDIWWDKDGDGEYYSYSLPHPIDNLRRLSHSVSTNQIDFLNGIQSLHEAIRSAEVTGKVDYSEYRHRLSDLCLDFFLTVFESAKRLPEKASTEAVDDNSKNVVLDFQRHLDVLTQDFNNKNIKNL